MNTINPNNNLSFCNDFSFLSQFSSGIEYCHYEQQIDISSSLLSEEKQEITFVLKIKHILVKWKKWITHHTGHIIDQPENKLLRKSQFLIKKISTDTACTSGLLVLTSVGIASEIIPRWSDNTDNFDNLPNNIPSKLDGEDANLQPITFPASQQKWLMYSTQASGSLMAIPPRQNQPSLAGLPSFWSTLDFVDAAKYLTLNQFNSFDRNKLSAYPENSVTYHIEDKLMAIPSSRNFP